MALCRDSQYCKNQNETEGTGVCKLKHPEFVETTGPPADAAVGY